jgi:hypothetical protein
MPRRGYTMMTPGEARGSEGKVSLEPRRGDTSF